MTPTPKAVRALHAESVQKVIAHWRKYVLQAMKGGFLYAECPRPVDVALRLQDQAADALFYELNAQGWIEVRYYNSVDQHGRECLVFEWGEPAQEAEEPVDNVVPLLKPRYEN